MIYFRENSNISKVKKMLIWEWTVYTRSKSFEFSRFWFVKFVKYFEILSSFLINTGINNSWIGCWVWPIIVARNIFSLFVCSQTGAVTLSLVLPGVGGGATCYWSCLGDTLDKIKGYPLRQDGVPPGQAIPLAVSRRRTFLLMTFKITVMINYVLQQSKMFEAK